MTIMSNAPVQDQHRRAMPVPCGFDWCIVELGGGPEDEALHVGNDLRVQAHAYPNEQQEVTVALEGYVGDVPAIRVQGGGDVALTPGDALALAQLLVAAARQAYGLPR